jgi:hypothetical protein
VLVEFADLRLMSWSILKLGRRKNWPKDKSTLTWNLLTSYLELLYGFFCLDRPILEGAPEERLQDIVGWGFVVGARCKVWNSSGMLALKLQ